MLHYNNMSLDFTRVLLPNTLLLFSIYLHIMRRLWTLIAKTFSLHQISINQYFSLTIRNTILRRRKSEVKTKGKVDLSLINVIFLICSN